MAIQFIPLIAAIVGGAATVGTGVYAYKNYQESQPQPPAATLVPKVQPVPKPAITQQPEKEPEVKITQPQLPVFHLLRAEEDGSVVIAGSAQAKSNVEILHAEKILASANATNNGDFAIVFDNPLAPGTYELFIRSTLDENILVSAEAGIINIPERGGEVIAMVTKAGEASKLIQVPKPKPVVEIKPEPASPQPVAKVEPKPEPAKVATAPVVEPKRKPVAAPVAVKPVLLGAVEVENSKLFIAGTGEPGRIINLYLNDRFVGTAVVNSQGAFLLESDEELDFGEHIVRADMLAKENAVVVARAQVPLVHDAPVVVAKAPEPTPARNLAAVEIIPPKPVVAKPKRAIRTGTSVIIRKGDNLWRVSRRILGQGIRYSTIYNANKSQIKNPSLIFPGQIFKVPEKMVDNAASQEG